jgi:transcriptional regulator with XRE-family HTH domain
MLVHVQPWQAQVEKPASAVEAHGGDRIPTLGELVRAHRRRLGLTQQDLTRLTGVGVRTIRNLEVGTNARPRPSTVRLLADAFGLVGIEREQFQTNSSPGPAPVASVPTRPRQRTLLVLDVRHTQTVVVVLRHVRRRLRRGLPVEKPDVRDPGLALHPTAVTPVPPVPQEETT